ncbi:MAG: GerMN domain-containing protein [Synergistaceae bacterium]|nr:GerMN domain-containing protein [Synergistaceae bacterium]
MPPLRRNDTGRPIPNRRRQAQQAMAEAEARRRILQHKKPRPLPQDYDEEKPTPLLLRILSLLGVILLCFVLGYLGTSWVVDFLNKKLFLKPENRIENQEDLSRFEESEREQAARKALMSGADVQQVSINIYHVKDDTIAEVRRNFLVQTREDNMRDAVNEIISLSGVPNADRIRLLHVFRNEDTAFLDMPGQFASSLNVIGKQKSLLLITSIVRTLQENFSPVSEVRFLLDSKSPSNGGIVDLSSVWKLPQKS